MKQNVGDEVPGNVLTTQASKFIDWSRKNSLWPMPFGTACCAIEFMAVAGPRYDLARLGMEVVRFSPRQADMMLVAGTIVEKMIPILKRIYNQMLEPKWVISIGACATSGGFYRAYHTSQGIDMAIPVDIYVPGCPPTPEAMIQGMIQIQELITMGRRNH